MQVDWTRSRAPCGPIFQFHESPDPLPQRTRLPRTLPVGAVPDALNMVDITKWKAEWGVAAAGSPVSSHASSQQPGAVPSVAPQ